MGVPWLAIGVALCHELRPPRSSFCRLFPALLAKILEFEARPSSQGCRGRGGGLLRVTMHVGLRFVVVEQERQSR